MCVSQQFQSQARVVNGLGERQPLVLASYIVYSTNNVSSEPGDADKAAAQLILSLLLLLRSGYALLLLPTRPSASAPV